jgi:hypothetical protein
MLRQIISDLHQAGLDGRVRIDRIAGRSIPRIIVRIGRTDKCITALMPPEEEYHTRFAKGLIDAARLRELELRAGRQFPVGGIQGTTKISYDDVHLIDVVS